MRSASAMFKGLKVVGPTAVLILGMGQVNWAQLTHDSETRPMAGTEAQTTTVAQKTGSTMRNTAAPCDASENKPEPLAQGAHSVTLSWTASAPVSTSPHDAVVGYFVYRSMRSHDRKAKAINSLPAPDTTCVDRRVKSGKTYYYAVRAVSASGVVSRSSKEIKVHVPR